MNSVYVYKLGLSCFVHRPCRLAMLVAELQLHSHHLLLALLVAPVLWVAKGWYQKRQISNANTRYIRLCQEGRKIKGIKPSGRGRSEEGHPAVPGPSGPRQRANAANFRP